MNEKLTIAIAGNPNCGKTALFNALTGSHQVVGNWPGVTVEKKEGTLVLDGKEIRVVDIPGTYALYASSEDELAAVRYLLSKEADFIINIVDATNLERNLFLTTQIAEMGVPMILALNMMDIADKRGMVIDLDKLSQEFGVPVIALSAISDKSCVKFVRKLSGIISKKLPLPKAMKHTDEVENAIAEISPSFDGLAKTFGASARWTAIQYLAGNSFVTEKATSVAIDREHLKNLLKEDPEFAMADSRYGYVHRVGAKAVHATLKKSSGTDKLDKVFLNRILGIPLFLAVMYLVFLVSVTIGSAFIDFFDVLFGAVFVDGFTAVLEAIHAPDFVIAILATGVGAGIQTVATFVPVVFFMFLCLSFLEDSGYMARAAFVADRLMRFLGLPGKAFVPMMVGFGCSVPAIMGSRVLESKRERFLTIFLVPFMSCGARLPVYALFAAAFFGRSAGTVVFLIYLVGIIIAILYGLLLRHSLFRGEASPFVMELPSYHIPKVKSLWRHTWLKLKDFILRAGKVVVIMVTILGFLSSVGTDGSFGNEDGEKSVLSAIGKTITPVFEPFGIEKENWPASVALFTGLFAKEAIVGTLNSLYSLNDSEEEEEEAFTITHFKDAVGEAFMTIPENLSGILESLTDPLGFGDVSTAELMEKKIEVLSKVEKAKNSLKISDEEFEALKGIEETEVQERALEKIKPLAFTEMEITALKEGEIDEEQTEALSGMRKYFTQGGSGFNFQVFAYLLFVLLYVPCMAALGTVFREIGAFYGTLLAVTQTLLGWCLSILTFQLTVGHNTLWIITSIALLIAMAVSFRIIGNGPRKIRE